MWTLRRLWTLRTLRSLIFSEENHPCRVPAGAFLCGIRHKRQIVIHRIRGIVISKACWLGGSE